MYNNPTFRFSEIVLLIILALIIFGSIGGIIYLVYYSEVLRISNRIIDVQKNINIIIDEEVKDKISETELFNSHGLDYLDKNDYINAEVYFRKAIEANPNFAYSYNNLGIVLSLTNREEEALKNFQKAVELNPSYANAYSNIGAHYRWKGDYVQAIANFQRAIEIDPNHFKSYVSLGDIYFLLNDYKSAEYFYKKSLELEGVDIKDADVIKKQVKNQLEYLNKIKY